MYCSSISGSIPKGMANTVVFSVTVIGIRFGTNSIVFSAYLYLNFAKV